MTGMMRFKIRRQESPKAHAYWEKFDIPFKPEWSVREVLERIQEQPLNANGKAIAPVVWDEGCHGENCGVCMMLINGRPLSACAITLSELKAPVTLEPLSKFPVVRDLKINRSAIFSSYASVKAWKETDGIAVKGPVSPLPAFSAETEKLAECHSCGACLEACPQYGKTSDYVGAAAVLQSRLYQSPLSGLSNNLGGRGGVADCGNAQNCVKVCPQNIPLTEMLARAKRREFFNSLRGIFG